MHSIDLWRFDLDQPEAICAALAQSLSAQEQARAARFVFERDRHRYIVGRGLLRLRLGGYLDCEAAQVPIVTTRHGKPRLPGAEPPLHFNLSHSGALAVLAVSTRFEVGVDVAELRDIEENLAERFFAPGECVQLRNVPPPERLAAFFRCWTRKEAFVKALGLGLSLPLDSFEVSIADESEPRLIGWRENPEVTARWRFFSFTLEHSPAKWMPVGAGKIQQTKGEKPHSDALSMEKTLGPEAIGALAFDAQGCDVAVNWRSAPAPDVATITGGGRPFR